MLSHIELVQRNVSSKLITITFWSSTYSVFDIAFLEVWHTFLSQLYFFFPYIPTLLLLFIHRQLRIIWAFMVWAKTDQYALLIILWAQQVYIITFSPKETRANRLQEGFPAKTSQFPFQTLLRSSFIMCDTKDPSRIETPLLQLNRDKPLLQWSSSGKILNPSYIKSKITFKTR